MTYGALDIHSPRGQANEVHNEQCWRTLMAYLRGAKCERLHDAHPADGVIRNTAGKPTLLVEVKSRHDFDEGHFWNVHRGEWLITNRKIIENTAIARNMGIPFAGALHIVRSRVVLVKILSVSGKVIPHTVKSTETQATINGGRIVRPNAYLPMHGAMELRYDA